MEEDVGDLRKESVELRERVLDLERLVAKFSSKEKGEWSVGIIGAVWCRLVNV